jgi:hypothetical protein
MADITQFPLSVSPYNSRNNQFRSIVSSLEGDTTSGDLLNFPLIAFKPGFPLQAQELNEMQENFEFQMQYDNLYLQRIFSQGSLSSGPITSVYNAAWLLDPNNLVYTTEGNTINITISNIVSIYDNGMRYWIRIPTLNTSLTLSSGSRFLKLNVQIEYVACSSDSSSIGFYFNDNSSGNFDSGTCGANRVRYKVESLSFVNNIVDNCILQVTKTENGFGVNNLSGIGGGSSGDS